MASDDFETELKSGFLDEAAQLLSDAEQCFLELESADKDPALLDKLFRLAHNLKGSARAVGFAEMAEFTHELESLLLKLKSKEIAITVPIVSLLLNCKDYLERFVQTLKDDHAASYRNDPLLNELKSAKDNAAVASALASLEPQKETHEPELETTPTSFEESVFAQEVAVVNEIDHFAGPETVADEIRQPEKSEAKSSSSDESIRVSLARVEKLINFVGELVILQTVMQEQQKSQNNSPLLSRTFNEISKVTKEIQSISMGLRMIPLKQTFQKMQRIVRDTAISVNKTVAFKMIGEDTELDKTVLENINDPLVHLIRNAVDHGIETPADRLAKGKPEAGTISMSAVQQADRIIIEIKDDGAGLDANRIRNKAIEKGLLTGHEKLSEQETLKLIFKPGFSTKTEVTDISGRGVGLDVVKTNIELVLHGEVNITSVLGEGTTFKISLPLTLAIADAMVIKSGKDRYIIPLSHVHETLKPAPKDVHFVSGMGQLLYLRGEKLPLFHLNHLLKGSSRSDVSKNTSVDNSIAIVLRSGKAAFAVTVHDIVGQHQIVLKRLGPEIRHIKGFSGSAVLGDGVPGIILDLPDLIRSKAS